MESSVRDAHYARQSGNFMQKGRLPIEPGKKQLTKELRALQVQLGRATAVVARHPADGDYLLIVKQLHYATDKAGTCR